MANTIPWIEKYRPNNINDIVYHDDIRNTLKVEKIFTIYFRLLITISVVRSIPK